MAQNSESSPRGPGVPFLPGQSGNPGGRPKLPEEVRAMRQGALEQVVRAYNKYATVTKGTGPAYPETPIDAGMALVIRQFAATGDTDVIRHVWDRVIGKAEAQINLDVAGLSQDVVFEINAIIGEKHLDDDSDTVSPTTEAD